jgi:hypothetical protein
MQRRSILAVAAALLAVVATVARADDGDSVAYHLFPTAAARAAQSKPDAQAATPRTMLYFGGPVLSHVKVVAVMWGADVDPTTSAKIGDFLAAAVNSTFMDKLKEYATNLRATDGHAGTNQVIGRGTYVGKFTIIPQNKARVVSDAAIQAELRGQIAAHKLPRDDLDTLYMVYFPAGITIRSFGKSCVTFEAYHSAASATATFRNLFYGVMPDCRQGFAEITYASSHEMAEAISDAIPTPGSHPAYPQAWNTHDGYEIADLCESVLPSRLVRGSQTYVVSRVFLNSIHRCGAGSFTSP